MLIRVSEISGTQSLPGLLLDNTGQKIYVIELATWKLLYANADATADKEDSTFLGKTCYEYVRKQGHPCPGCVVNQLHGKQPLQTEWYDQVRDKMYEVRVVPMTLFGKSACAFFIRDISKRLKLTRELQIEHEKFKLVTEKANLRAYEYRIDSHTIDLPEYAARLFGSPTHVENVPESVLPLFQEQDYDRVRKFFARVDSGEDNVAEEFQMKEVNGVSSWLRYHFSTVYGDDGRPVKAYAVASDITTQKNLEKRLTDERMRIETLGDNIILAFTYNVTKNSNAKFVFAKGCEDFFNTHRDESLMKKLDQLAPVPDEQKKEARKIMIGVAAQICEDQDRQKFINTSKRANLLQAFAEGRRRMELQYRTRLGKMTIWVSTVINLLQDPKTGDVIVFFYDYDITEQKIYQNMTARILSLNYEMVSFYNVSTGRISTLQAHATGKLFADFSYEEAIGELMKTVSPTEDTAMLREKYSIKNIFSQLEKESIYTVYFTRGDRAENLPGHPCRRMRHAIFYLDNNKDIIVSILEDVTGAFEQERENREKLTKALKSAQTANEAKSEFLSRMSHDIRTPLNGIIGMTGIARKENQDPAIADYLSKIDSSGHFLLGLVNDILDMSKVESHKMQLHPEHYDFAEFEEYINSVIRPLCNNKGIQLIIDRKGICFPVVMVDKLRINQIFFNLLSNAAKFTPRGGTVRFSVRNTGQNGNVAQTLFIVQDNGIGMSAGFREKLFHPFEQENTQKDYQRVGSGLGLSIVRSLVDLMGGTIDVKTAPGEGSTFIVILPMVVAPTRKVTPIVVGKQNYNLTGVNVLVTEDNLINQEIALKLLEMKGAHGTVANNGEEAVRQFDGAEQYSYDAVLMDVRMPVMDGLTATRKIRALNRPDARTVPIIAMTANAFEEDVKECLDAGMDAHLAKPIEPKDLYETIGRLVRQLHH